VKIRSALKDLSTIKALLTGAESEARQTGDSLPGAEHLLLSALALPDGTARRAFERAGADPDELREAISPTHPGAPRSLGIVADDAAAVPPSGTLNPATGVMRTSASAQQAFQAAVKLSKATKPSRLLGAHVVLAVCQMEHGTTARALASLRIDRASLGAAAREELGIDS
jgi:ATP-dependent Clp protease ATP-binding subunit ClpA